MRWGFRRSSGAARLNVTITIDQTINAGAPLCQQYLEPVQRPAPLDNRRMGLRFAQFDLPFGPEPRLARMDPRMLENC